MIDFSALNKGLQETEQALEEVKDARNNFWEKREESSNELNGLLKQTSMRLEQDNAVYEESREIINSDLDQMSKDLEDLLK